ncbi:hypothetical protein [uncultured Bosea sp.]|uniref:hypothetical protein n=1 Tax=uncultured Bosea sp. TaxID=211457 RepID=UPI0025F9A728|nr:hypothetical protein [uncultured Bosea sp.]
MPYIQYRDPLDPGAIQDVDTRKGVFRAMAKDFLDCNRAKAVTDAPGTLARMLEHAYKAGMTVARNDPEATATDRLVRRMAILDLPSLTQSTASSLKRTLFSQYNKVPHQPAAKHLYAFLQPRDPRFPTTISRDEWRVAGSYVSPYSSKAFGPLVKAGLYNMLDTPGQSLQIAILTEWGFELIATGETSFDAERQPGRSTTFARYEALLADGRTGYQEAVAEVFK